MDKPQHTAYKKIAEAIEQLQSDSTELCSSYDIADKIQLNPFELQKIFKDWAGVDFEEFQYYTSKAYTKETLNSTSTETIGMHLPPLKIEPMTAEEYNGKKLTIKYSFAETIFGRVLMASTQKGICYIAFSEDDKLALAVLEKRFSQAHFAYETDAIQQQALLHFSPKTIHSNSLPLHLKATDFQLKVSQALLKIPMASLVTYADIAMAIRQPKAARAVGTAIGSNLIALLIPCHRVIPSTGLIGEYMWGPTRKKAIIGWEAAQKKLRLKG
ncbi:MAG TPA: methylated-DNA--[protein]-cysteine S-methyltransferase [Flavobacterium sp.]|nr:methylated-DNA--[protein]-cysteine S-methyltransferase [Flavobacterium sp.]